MSNDAANARKTKTAKPRTDTPQSHSDKPRASTRQDLLLRQLRRKSGTDVPTMCKTFGRQSGPDRAQDRVSGMATLR